MQYIHNVYIYCISVCICILYHDVHLLFHVNRRNQMWPFTQLLPMQDVDMLVPTTHHTEIQQGLHQHLQCLQPSYRYTAGNNIHTCCHVKVKVRLGVAK